MQNNHMNNDISPVLGLILAGGRARRLGGADKALVELSGRPLLQHVITRLRPQLASMVINANDNPRRFAAYDLPVISDSMDDAGPLAGVLAGMEWAASNMPEVEWVATVAVDTPFFPANYINRMQAGISRGADMARACSNGRAHPVFGIWPLRLAAELRNALEVEGLRKIDLWTARFNCADIAFSGNDFDPFFNINTPEDVKTAEGFK